ncbi:MAG: DUF58 domain-containing protein [Candidatus Methylomirabilales bacterium]
MLSRRSLRPTWKGGWFLLITLATGFGALNTGNNLLYLILAMLLTFIMISGVLSGLSLHGLRIERRLPVECFAGTQTTWWICLTNTKRLLPTLALRVEERQGGEVMAARLLFRLDPSEAITLPMTATFPCRGWARWEDVRLVTQYPFGFFRKVLRTSCPGEILVYPTIRPLLELELGGGGAIGEQASARSGSGPDLFDVRPFREGDDLRWVHWKLSAKAERWVVREFRALGRDRMAIVLEPPEPPLPNGDPVLERDVSLAASLAAVLIRKGTEVCLVAGARSVPWGVGEGHLRRLLQALALLNPATDLGPAEVEGGTPLRIQLGSGNIYDPG